MKKILIIIITGIVILSLLLFVLISLLEGSNANIEPSWHRTWGEDEDEWAQGMTECNGELYVLCSMGGHIMLLNYNTEGDLIWERDIGGYPYANEIISSNDFLYVLASDNDLGTRQDVVLSKYDTDGNREWQVFYDDGMSDLGYDITEYEGHLYIVGRSYASEGERTLLLKYDTDGNLIWERTWFDLDGCSGGAVVGYGGDIYVAGLSRNFTSREYFDVLLKYDQDGNLLWARITDGELYYTDTNNNLVGFDGAIYMVGTGPHPITEDASVILIEYDLDGDLIKTATWSRYKYTSNTGNAMVISGGYIYIAGSTTMETSDDRDMFLLKYDTDFNLIWSKLWGSDGMDVGADLVSYDGFLYILGETESSETDGRDVFLMKINTFEISPYWGAFIILLGVFIAIVVDVLLIKRSKKQLLKSDSEFKQNDDEMLNTLQIGIKDEDIEIGDDQQPPDT